MKAPSKPPRGMKLLGNSRPTSGPKGGRKADMTPAKHSGKRAGGKVC